MEISFIGLSVGVAVWLLGGLLGSPLIVGMVVSVAFGSTSAVTLSALGGSSPLLYLVFEIGLIGCVLCDKRLLAGAVEALGRNGVGWAIGALIIYSAVGAFIMPRLFAGATNAFVPVRPLGVVEIALAPNSGNITQTGYFILGALAFLALSSRLARGEPLATLRNGFLAWATVNAISGVLDLGAKVVGAGDVFMPIRTATFAFLTEVAEAGFWRINGLYPEASSYGGAALASLAFTFTYWVHSGSRRALLLTLLLLSLIVLSTSSTAYAGLAVMMIPAAASLFGSVLRGRLEATGMIVLACIIVGISTIIFVTLYDSSILDPFQHLFQTTLWDKSESESGRERAYWNQRSLQSLYDTFGLGIGFGSSRSSNWLIAVISQLGIVGAALQLALILPFLRRPQRPQRSSPAYGAFVLHRSLCACVFALLATAIISGGAADPGLLFFVALAGVLACQASMRRSTNPVRLDPALPASPGPGPVYAAVGRLARTAMGVRPTPDIAAIVRPPRRPQRADLASPAEFMPAIKTLRTAAPGLDAEARLDFGRRAFRHSWRNRIVPHWQGDHARKWLDARAADLPPVRHVDAVFSLPAEFVDFAFLEALAYDLLCKAAFHTTPMAADPQHIGPHTEIPAVLSIWSPTAAHHPHVPMFGSVGGTALQEEHWIASPGPLLLLIRVRLVLRPLDGLRIVGPRIVGDRPGASPFMDAAAPLADVSRNTRSTISDGRLISYKAGATVLAADVFLRRSTSDHIPYGALIANTGRDVIMVQRAREPRTVASANLGMPESPPTGRGHYACVAAVPRWVIGLDAIRATTTPRLLLPARPQVLLPTRQYAPSSFSGASLRGREANSYDAAHLLEQWPRHH